MIKLRQHNLLKTCAISGVSFALSCCSQEQSQTPKSGDGLGSSAAVQTLFTEVKDVIPFEDMNRRKFDSPVIGDLDQDGRQDVIINEHGKGMRVFWNNGETFFEGPYIFRGDVHGAAVADFDTDNLMDIIITQGGGDGGNPKRPVWVTVGTDRVFTKAKPFDYFEPGRGRAVSFIPDVSTGALDLLITGFPMPNQTEGANHFYKNAGEGAFTFKSNLPQAKWLGYRPLLTDFNFDGLTDIIFYGGNDMIAVEGKTGRVFADVTDTVFSGLRDLSDVSKVTEIDFDNDGDFDLFLSRSEHQFDIESYYNSEERRFAFISFRKDYLFDDILVEGDLIIENLQRTYPHKQVFLGANKKPLKIDGDNHGGHNLTIKVEDALGWPKGEVTGGLYIGYIGDGYWRIGGQSRSRTAATFANVDAATSVTPQIDLPARMFENRDGTFVDVTDTLRLNIPDQTTGAATADFNNDGWMDLAVLRYGSMASRNEHVIYLNQGGKSFKKAKNHGLKATEVGATGGFVETFDYDSDGHMDILYSNERGKWHLMKNQSPEARKNKFVVVKVGASPETAGTPQGSVLTLKACGNTHVRKVGATSATFSQGMNTELHVGLGQCEKIDSVDVKWINGEAQSLSVTKMNTAMTAGH